MKISFQQLMNLAKQHSPLKTAVIHPTTAEALSGALEAERQKLIIPILVGPFSKINKAAKALNISLKNYKIISTEHSHAAAEEGVALARSGKVNMLMKGSLHTEEFMLAILNHEKGLRTDRRMSHIFALEVPAYDKLLLLTDSAINIVPTFLQKRDIAQNAIDFALAIGIKKPKIAILSAIETITDKISSTIDAAVLCKMSDRKQICGGVLDGPLAFDNAISSKATKLKGIQSPVAGKADILLVPNLEAGNMLAKQLEYLSKAKAAGLVLGARIPIVVTSRADDADARLVSCALGVLYEIYLQKKRCKKRY